MISIHQYHIPVTLKEYSFLSIGKDHQYWEAISEERFAAQVDGLEALVKKNTSIALVLTGTFIAALQSRRPTLVAAIKQGVKNGKIVLLGTTYHFSLASLYDVELFAEQIKLHQTLVKTVFDYTPEIFFNVAAIYFDKLAAIYADAGFSTAIAPISEWHLNGRSPQVPYLGKDGISVLLIADDQVTVDSHIVGVDSTIDIPSLLSKRNKKSSESYRVPQPIYNKKLVLGKTLSSNTLQNSLHQKIGKIKKKIMASERFDLLAPLSLFTSVDFFEQLTKTDDQNNTAPYDHYNALIDILADFELFNKI